MDNQFLNIWLEPKSIAVCDSLPDKLHFMKPALQHQVEVYEKSRNHDLILDLAPTGTGKTKAGFTVLLHNPNQTAIYIAPTNALVTQQAEAAEAFVRDAKLTHVVKAASAKEIQGWSDDRVGKRSGEKLYNLLQNPATIFPEVGANRPLFLVTNPDIFYYATFWAYNSLDKSNIASEFYSRFSTIIFDEFHLYSAKQLVSLLFFIAYSKVLGYFQHDRKIVILTATPEKACDEAFNTLERAGIRIARIDGESNHSNQVPSQTKVALEIRPKIERDEYLVQIADEVKEKYLANPNDNGAVILDSKDHINRLADLLTERGLKEGYGRIHGSTPQKDRLLAVQKPIILATSTVDVGFNFEKNPVPTRQTLDWLIFSAKDRHSFWQRLGRVGRVLGRKITDIPSEAIAYIDPKAWEEGILELDRSGGRESLRKMLESLSCLDRPFLSIYWRSEASLEIARPLSELEDLLTDLPQISVIEELYQTMRCILGGTKDWSYYRSRMRVFTGAEKIKDISIKELKSDWKFTKGGQALIKTFFKCNHPEYLEEIKADENKIKYYEDLFKKYPENFESLKNFARTWYATYQPIFQFRDSLFDNLKVYDRFNLLLDESEETVIDPIHLLRYYDFDADGQKIELRRRVDEPYELKFVLYTQDSFEEFKQKKLNRLIAFEDCTLERRLGGAKVPTTSLKELRQQFVSGVIVSTQENQGTIIQLRKQGLTIFPMYVHFAEQPRPKEFTFFPSLSGILAIASSGRRLKLPDGEDFYIA
ncbi:MAG: type I-D CRISPR-associated helicase Cas3' [Microcystis aeruginosa L211-101]|nr:type I-D CRISPR-associated helicase Cas3' [Microcystis aeruginosa L211-11]NCR31207.1 type I-D CRISPR-associated helicase Cas3' [Microcystis aeruginosa L211-101]